MFCVLLVVCWLLRFVARCLLFLGCCYVLFVVCWLLLVVVCCLLRCAYCLVRDVRVAGLLLAA